MLFRLSKNSFVRVYDDFGYIVNQCTKKDRIYNKIGSLFLNKISRVPKDIKEVVKTVHTLFHNVSYEVIENDFCEFLNDLEKNKFIVTGYSIEELISKDCSFTYSFSDTTSDSFPDTFKQTNLPKTKKVLNNKFYKNPTLFALQIELTTHCNENCIHCYIPNSRRGNILDFKTVCSVLDQARILKTLALSFSGGEPLLHPDFSEIIQYARENDFSVSVLTNLTYSVSLLT